MSHANIKKAQQQAKRKLNSIRALLRHNKVAIVRNSPSGDQYTVSLKTMKMVVAGDLTYDGLFDYSHHWDIYVAGLCRKADGEQYVKPETSRPVGQYRPEHLSSVVQDGMLAVGESCNKNHLVGMVWIATPYPFDIDDETAKKVLELVGAWSQATGIDELKVA